MTTGTTQEQLSVSTSAPWGAARTALLANLAGEILIVLTGGLVRLTGSGLGCPTWPQCTPGSFTPVAHQAEGYHTNIEFGNRLLTFALTAAAIAVLVTVWRADRSRWRAAALPLVLVIAQAVLGGITVLVDLAPLAVAGHLLLSMVAIAVSAWLLFVLPPRTSAQKAPSRVAVPSVAAPLVWLTAVACGAVLVLGTVVTGTGPHSGDATRPARYDFDPRLVSMVHAASVWMFVLGMIALVIILKRAGAVGRLYRWTHVAVGISVVQGALGYLQYATGVPWGLVAVHMLLAAVIVVPVTAMVESVRHAPAP